MTSNAISQTFSSSRLKSPSELGPNLRQNRRTHTTSPFHPILHTEYADKANPGLIDAAKVPLRDRFAVEIMQARRRSGGKGPLCSRVEHNGHADFFACPVALGVGRCIQCC